MPRPKHFDDYEQFTEVVPGVYVEPGQAVYIVDDFGEVVSWNLDEWLTDSESVTATVNAVILATKKGANAVRQNLLSRGVVLEGLINATFDEMYPEYKS